MATKKPTPSPKPGKGHKEPKPKAKKPAKPAAEKKTAPEPAAKASPAKDLLTAYGIEALCASIVEGSTLTAVAEKVGVSIGTLIVWLEADPERSACAREARTRSARMWDELALTEIRLAGDPFELARARESAQHLRWRASKIAPKEYGEKIVHASDPENPMVTQLVVTSGGILDKIKGA